MTTATDHKNNLNRSTIKKHYPRTLRVCCCCFLFPARLLCVMYLYICVHTWDPEISVSGPWPFCFKFPLIRLCSMAIRPRRVLHRGPVASYCPVFLHPEVWM